MSRVLHVASLLAGLLVAAFLSASPVLAQEWPTRPIRLIVPFAPGGATDIIARLLGSKLTGVLGQQIVVENRTGAGGNIGSDVVAKAAPDGYTIMLTPPGALTINHFLFRTMPFPPDAFAPVILVGLIPGVLAVNNAVPATNLQELIALVRTRSGGLNYSTSGNGSTGHVVVELLKRMAGIEATHVPFRGSAPSLAALMAGEVQLVSDSVTSVMALVQSKSIRPIAVTTRRRWPGLPDVPTVAESGLPEFEAASWLAVVAPKGTPASVIAKLNGALDGIIAEPDMRQRLYELGCEPVGGTPERLAGFVATEFVKWREVVESSGARAD